MCAPRAARVVRLVEIAELLGVSKQRAHQLAAKPDFPAPITEDDRGRVWDQRDLVAWAKTGAGSRRYRSGPLPYFVMTSTSRS